jgi:hypothetical protein
VDKTDPWRVLVSKEQEYIGRNEVLVKQVTQSALLKLERQFHEAVTFESKCMGQSLVGLNGNGIRDNFKLSRQLQTVRWNDRSLPKECGATCSTVKRPARAMHALWRHD